MSDFLIRWSVRLALVGYAIRLAADLKVFGTQIHWQSRTIRAAWSCGCALLAVHIALAFHFIHHWSHSSAYADTARQTAALTGWNWGGGLYLNELTLVLWSLDVGWMLVAPLTYGRRSSLIGVALHGWVSFMAFNGAVVFESGPTRWISLAVCLSISALAFHRRFAPHSTLTSNP